MNIPSLPKCHLTYCLNVHPGETWEENLAAIRKYACAVRDAIAPARPFGLGLRLGNRAAGTLVKPDSIRKFKEFLDAENLYVFTINGFPYGRFHGAPVKTNVYCPSWTTIERLSYTKRLMDILAQLLPEGVDGSISTVPGAYRALVKRYVDVAVINRNLLAASDHAAGILKRTGRRIRLALEPEPDCLIEKMSDIATFFDHSLFKNHREWRNHLGICLDTCHLAVRFENPVEGLRLARKHGVSVFKVQLSAAVETHTDPRGIAALRQFTDPVYLHQVTAKTNRATSTWPDLEQALDELGRRAGTLCRVHCHVPLYFAERGALRSTSALLTPGLLREAVAHGVRHFEIETYTMGVLPPWFRRKGLVSSIQREYRWILKKFRNIHA